MKKKNRLLLLGASVLATAFLSLVGGASAQSYSISWYKVAGGGGSSTGGVYTVSGTAGQPDAGHLSGGNYSVDGGFWGLVAVVQTPGAPLLTIVRSGSNAVVSWPSPATGFVLQFNTDLNVTNGWALYGGIIGDDGSFKSTTNAPAAGNKFFRLQHP